MADMKRRTDEDLFDYQVRLCRDRELYGLSWQGVADLLNAELDNDYTESRYRKWWAAFSQGIEYERSNRVDGGDDELVELQKERYRLADQRRVYNATIREQARLEYIREEIRKSIAELNEHKPIQWSKPVIHGVSNVEGVALWSDWHYGMKTDNHFNKYDSNVFYRRLDTLIMRTIEHGKRHGIRTLHVMNLDDSINGHIHISTRIQSTEDVIRQTQHVAEAMSESLTRLASEFETVKFYSTRGNHNRVSNGSKDANVSSESFADIIPWYLKARLCDVGNIEIVDNPYDDEVIVASVAGHYVFGVHGHKDKPEQVAANLSLMLKVVPNSIYLGHYHHSWERESTGGVDVIVNPSFCGTDEYARDIRKVSKPAQKFLVYGADGRICTYNINLA